MTQSEMQKLLWDEVESELLLADGLEFMLGFEETLFDMLEMFL